MKADPPTPPSNREHNVHSPPPASRARDDESLVKLGAKAAGLGLLGVVVWLAPVVILGGIGLLIISASSTETTNAVGYTTETFNDRGMWTGLFFLSLAAACFFGRGALKQVVAVIKGEASLVEIAYIRGSIIGLLIAVGAIGLALVSLYMATIGS